MDNFKFNLKYRAINPICFNLLTEDTQITTHECNCFYTHSQNIDKVGNVCVTTMDFTMSLYL
jgi:hypothetical protein